MSKKKHVYKYNRIDNKVIAEAKYNQELVTGCARCNSNDVFDEEFGKKLAVARCNIKVLHKKEVNSRKRHKILKREVDEAIARLKKEVEFMTNVHAEYEQAVNELETMLEYEQIVKTLEH